MYDTRHLGENCLKTNPIQVNRLADSGAQLLVISLDMASTLGDKQCKLSHMKLTIPSANRTLMPTTGELLLFLSLGPDENGLVGESHQMAYVVAKAKQLFVFQATLIDLGILTMGFLNHKPFTYKMS